MSIRTYPGYPQQTYLATNSTQASFDITAGRKAIALTAGQLHLSGATHHRLVPIGGARGAAFQFFGTDANDEIITAVKIWIVTFANFAGATSPLRDVADAGFCDLNLYGTTGAATLSTATGPASGDLVPTTSFIADTVASWTASAVGSSGESAYGLGLSKVYSPTGNVPATLLIPNFGPLAHAFLVEFDLGTAASANALYTLTP